MTDEEMKNVKRFEVEYDIYVDVMSLQKRDDDVIINTSGGQNESNNS